MKKKGKPLPVAFKEAQREIRRLRRMLRVVVVSGHYILDCDCEGCDAHREVHAWK